MKVKIHDMIFDSYQTAIMLILNEEEKELISQMGDQTKFLSFPEDMTPEEAVDFMNTNGR